MKGAPDNFHYKGDDRNCSRQPGRRCIRAGTRGSSACPHTGRVSGSFWLLSDRPDTGTGLLDLIPHTGGDIKR